MVDVVGLGSQDDLEYAEEFVSTFGTTFTMLWDPGFESWAQLGVALQPSAMLLGRNGELLGKWLGMPGSDIAQVFPSRSTSTSIRATPTRWSAAS